MKLERRLTAGQVAGVAVVGSLLLYGAALQWLIPYHPHLKHWHSFGEFLWVTKFEIARFVAPLILGMWIQYGALAAMKRGVADGVWGEASLARLRMRLETSGWFLAASAMTLGALAFLVVGLVGLHLANPGRGGAAYFYSSPMLCLAVLRQTLRPKTVEVERSWPGDVKPIVSEHWGEGGVSGVST